MGSPLGPLMANAFMCMLEERLASSGRLPIYYRRYVDDTIAIFPDIMSHNEFFNHLNSLHPSIKFTADLADNGVLPFVGVNCIHVGSRLETSVHHKATDTGLLLHYHSHVDQRYKLALLRTMLTRAYRICSSWIHLHTECTRIQRVFSNLQYPASLITRAIKDMISTLINPPAPRPKPTVTSPAIINRLVLPYKSADLSRSLRSDLNDLNKRLGITIKPVFTSVKVKDMVCSKQVAEPDSIVSKSKVVYNYRCSCESSYIGYTSRHLHQRIAEHYRNSSAIQQHCKDTGHAFSEDNFTVICKCRSKFDCILRESHEIYFNRPKINARDEYSCSLLYRLRLKNTNLA